MVEKIKNHIKLFIRREAGDNANINDTGVIYVFTEEELEAMMYYFLQCTKAEGLL